MNEAAERLRDFVRAYVRSDKRLALIDEALAAERRATVERIRAAMLDVHSYEQSNGIGVFPVDDLERILDDEAAR